MSHQAQWLTFPQHYTIIAVTFMIVDAHPNLG